jgi:predicted outer membrane lipoprotein
MSLWYNGDGHQRPCLLLGLVESLPWTYGWFAGDGDTNVLVHSLACTYGIMERDTNVLFHSLACTYGIMERDTNVLVHSLACAYGITEMDTNVLVYSLDSKSHSHALMVGLLEMGTPTSLFTP